MFRSGTAALRRVAEFCDDVPLGFLAANPQTRHASERRRAGTNISGNAIRSRTLRTGTSYHEQITCTIEDPLGIVLARWWLRKRSVPELLGPELEHLSCSSSDHAAQDVSVVDEEVDSVGIGNGKTLLLKNCRLYLRCLGGAGVQVSKYVLSLGELMTFGIVERVDMSYFRLQATNAQLYSFLGQPVGLRMLRCRHVNVDMGELFALMTANAPTLSVVEMSSYELPTLQLFSLLPRVTELELRNATILNRPVVFHTQTEAMTPLPAPPPSGGAAAGALIHLEALKWLQKLDLSGLRSRLDFTGLLGSTSLRLLNLSSSVVTNEDIVAIAKLTGLQDLFLSHTGIDQVTALSQCSTLQTIQLSHTDVTTQGIQTLESLENLRQLDLSYTKVDDVNAFGASKSLNVLNIWKTRVKSSGISALGGLMTLQHLLAGDNEIQDVNNLEGCVALKRLSLQSTLVTSSGIAGIGSLPELEDLNLSNTLVTDVSVLGEAVNLKKLDLTGARVTSEGLTKLRSLPSLSAIVISKTDIEGLQQLRSSPGLCEIVGKRCKLASLEGVEDMPLLTSLVATHCPVSSANCLKGCPHLTSVNLWASKVDQAGIAELGACQSLVELDLAETLVTSITPLLTCTQLTTLVLYSSEVKSIDGIEALHSLKRLDIANTAVLKLWPLARCTALETLNVSDTDIDDEGFRGVERLVSLRTLLLSSTRVTRIGQLGLCVELTELHASKCAVTSAGTEGLEGARKLEKLNLSYTEVGAGVTRLAWCRWLQKLNLKFTKVPQEDIETLRSFLPKCRILAY